MVTGELGRHQAAKECDGGASLSWLAALQERILLLGGKEESRGLDMSIVAHGCT